MKKATFKTYHGVAFSYGFLALGFLVITGFTISLLGWHGIDQFQKDMQVLFPKLTPIFIFALLNAFMAVASWGYFNYSTVKKIAISSASLIFVALPAFSLFSTVANEVNKQSQMISVVIAVNYSILSFCLLKGISSNK